MTGAPIVNGVIGAGIAWLDTMLLTGFNIKSVTNLIRSGTTCTLTTSTSHGFLIGDIIGVYGADSSWNDLYQVTTVPDSTNLTFETTGTPTTPASGTITIKYPPIGSYLVSGNLQTYWTKVISGTNKAIYRSLDPASTKWYLRVDDTLTRYMTVSIIEGYSTIDIGLINQLNTQWVKSFTQDAISRPWQFVGDSKRFYPSVLWTNYATQVNSNAYEWYFFGDILSAKPGDAYHCGIIGTGTYPVLTSASSQGSTTYTSFSNISAASFVESYILRKYDQYGVQVTMSRWGMTNTLQMGSTGGFTHPNPSNAGTFIDQQLFVIDTSSIRGKMPGVYPPISNIQHNLTNRDTSVIKDGHQYMYFRLYNETSNPGGFFMDVTPNVPWSL